jgi:hypothetical protein
MMPLAHGSEYWLGTPHNRASSFIFQWSGAPRFIWPSVLVDLGARSVAMAAKSAIRLLRFRRRGLRLHPQSARKIRPDHRSNPVAAMRTSAYGA